MYSFSPISKYFLIPFTTFSLPHWLFRNVLFNFHISVNFPNFLLSWFLISLPHSQRAYLVWSVLFNLLSLILWPSVWPDLENIPRALEKNLYSSVVERRSLQTFVSYNWCIALYQYSVFSFNFWLAFLPFWMLDIQVSNCCWIIYLLFLLCQSYTCIHIF